MFPSLAKKIGFPIDALIDKYASENKITPAEKSIGRNYAEFCLENQYDLWIAPFTHLKNVLSFQIWSQEKHKVVKSQAGRFLKWCVLQEIFRVLPNTQAFVPFISPFLQKFLDEYDFNTRTKTKETYQNALLQYEKFSEKTYGQFVFGVNAVKDFKNYLIEKQTSPFTTNNYLSCLRTLANWAIINASKLQISPENVQELTLICKIKSEKIDNSQYHKDSFTEQETFVFLDSIDDYFDKMLFATMLLGGLRTIEVRRLLIQDIDLANQQMWLLRKGKTTKKPYPMPTSLLGYWVDFFEKKQNQHKKTKNTPSNQSKDNENENSESKNNQNKNFEAKNQLIFGVNYHYIWKKFRKYAKKLGFWKENMPIRVSPHSCRHTAIQHIKNKLGLEDAQQFAGHSNITSTMPYAQKTIQEQFADKIKNVE